MCVQGALQMLVLLGVRGGGDPVRVHGRPSAACWARMLVRQPACPPGCTVQELCSDAPPWPPRATSKGQMPSAVFTEPLARPGEETQVSRAAPLYKESRGRCAL